MPTDRRRKLHPEESRELLRRRAAGEAASVLAKEYGISKKTVDDLYQQTATRRAQLSRRQLNHYLKWLGQEPANAQRLIAQKPASKKSKQPHPSRKKLDAKTWEEIQKLHANGTSLKELSLKFGVSRQALHGRLKRQPLVPMTLEHLDWLKEQLMPKGRRRKKTWNQQQVRRLLTNHFGERISLRTFRSHLEWLGVRSPNTPGTAARREALREAKKRAHHEQEQRVLAAIQSGDLPAIVRGRPKGRQKTE
jgi:predicted DNA-binding protein YlxM (UPF0122 family)